MKYISLSKELTLVDLMDHLYELTDVIFSSKLKVLEIDDSLISIFPVESDYKKIKLDFYLDKRGLLIEYDDYGDHLVKWLYNTIAHRLCDKLHSFVYNEVSDSLEDPNFHILYPSFSIYCQKMNLNQEDYNYLIPPSLLGEI